MPLLTTSEAADRLGISRGRVHALMREKRLKATRKGWIWLIDSKDLRAVRNRKPGRPKKSR